MMNIKRVTAMVTRFVIFLLLNSNCALISLFEGGSTANAVTEGVSFDL